MKGTIRVADAREHSLATIEVERALIDHDPQLIAEADRAAEFASEGGRRIRGARPPRRWPTARREREFPYPATYPLEARNG